MAIELRALNRIVVCGVTIHDDTFDGAVGRIANLLDSSTCATLLFVNANSLNLASKHPSFRDILNNATLVYSDGIGPRWAALARGLRFHGALNGSDLVPTFLERTGGRRCYLLGGTHDGIEKAVTYFRVHFPMWTLAGYEHGYSRGRDDEILRSIDSSCADLLLVGMGSPLQEEWIARNRGALGVRLAVGVGGLFDYWAGFLTRAPRWMIRNGLEWAFILSQQHHKAARYLIGNPMFVARTVYYLPYDLRANWSSRALRRGVNWSE